MKIAKIYSDKDKRNYARQGPLFKEGDKGKTALATSFTKGWWSHQPITVTPLTKDEIDAAVKARQQEWEQVKVSELEYVVDLGDKKVTIVPAEYRLAWESVFTDGKGKILHPEYSNVYAFRRMDTMILVVALQQKLKLPTMDEIACTFDKSGKPTDFGIPTIVKTYADEFDRVEDCALENFGKSKGLESVDADWPTIVKVTGELQEVHRRVKGKPVSQSKVVETFGTRHTGQKAYYLMVLNTMYPDLNVFGNIISGKTPGGPMDRMDLLELTDEKKKNHDDVARYLANPKAERAKKAKRMSDKDIDSFIKECPCMTLKEILRAVRTDDSKVLYNLYGFATRIDAVCKDFLTEVREQATLRDSVGTPTQTAMPDLTPVEELPSETAKVE